MLQGATKTRAGVSALAELKSLVSALIYMLYIWVNIND